MDLHWKEKVFKHAIRMFPLTQKPEEAPILIMLIKEYENINRCVEGTYDDYSFHRDLAEAYILVGELDLALEHAVSCNKLCPLEIKNRKDIIAKIKFLKGDTYGGLEAINDYDGLGKKRTLDLVKYIQEYYKDNLDIRYLKNKYKIIFKYIEKHFGNWETAVFKAKVHQISSFPTAFIKLKEQSYYDDRSKEIINEAEKSLIELNYANESLRRIYDLIDKKEYSLALNEINEKYNSENLFMLGIKAKILFSMKRYNEIINIKLLRKSFWGREFYIKAYLVQNRILTSDDILWLSIFNIQIDRNAIENYYNIIIKIIDEKIRTFQETNNVSINEYLNKIINDNNFLNMWDQLSLELFKDIKDAIIKEIGEDVRWINEHILYTRIKDSFKDYTIIMHHKPKWLEPQHLDIFIPQLSLAIEYNGEQHYHPVEYFGGIESFQNTLERDARKKTLCEINKISLEIVKYDQKFDEVIKMLNEKYLRNKAV